MFADPFGILFQNIDGLCFTGRIRIGEKRLAAVYDGVPRKDAHGGFDGNAFAGTGFTHDGHRLIALQVEIHAADGMDRTGAGIESNIQIFDLKDLIAVVCHGTLLTYLRWTERAIPGVRRR